MDIGSGIYDLVGIGYSDDPYKEWALDHGHLGTFHLGISLEQCEILDEENLVVNSETLVKSLVIPDRLIPDLIPQYNTEDKELQDTQTTMLMTLWKDGKQRHLITTLCDITIIEEKKIVSYFFNKTLEFPVKIIISEKEEDKWKSKKGTFTIRTVRQKNEMKELEKVKTVEEVIKLHEGER
jgi:hypothetical protein